MLHHQKPIITRQNTLTARFVGYSAKKIGIHFELEQYFEESGHEPDAEKIPHKIS
jgi:hypothetical protein